MRKTIPVELTLPVDETKVIDKVIDVYMWITDDLNTAEVIQLSHHLIDLANRRATDVELYYRHTRYPEEEHVPIESILMAQDLDIIPGRDYPSPEDLPF